MHPPSAVPAGKCSGSGTTCSSNDGCPQTEVCLIQDVPAVSVTVSKTVPTFFAKMVGVTSFQPKATAVVMYAVTEPVSIGDDIQIAPGTKETLYHSIQKDFIGQVVQVPVVLDPMLNTNSKTSITGFMRFRIDRVIGSGANSQIAGHFVAYYADDGTEQPGGATGNSVTPPALVK